MKGPGDTHIVDITTITKSHFFGFVFHSARTETGWLLWHKLLALGNCLDRIENFDVASTATQVCSEMTTHI